MKPVDAPRNKCLRHSLLMTITWAKAINGSLNETFCLFYLYSLRYKQTNIFIEYCLVWQCAMSLDVSSPLDRSVCLDKNIAWISCCMRQTACLVLTWSWFITLVSPFIARELDSFQTQWQWGLIPYIRGLMTFLFRPLGHENINRGNTCVTYFL